MFSNVGADGIEKLLDAEVDYTVKVQQLLTQLHLPTVQQ